MRVQALAMGRYTERDALLPAVATLLRATPAEFQALRSQLEAADNPMAWLRGG